MSHPLPAFLLSAVSLTVCCGAAAAQPSLLKDTWPGTSSGISNLNRIATVGSQAFFAAYDTTQTYVTLWRSNGSPTGTYQVKTFLDVPSTSAPPYTQAWLTPMGNLMFFIGRESQTGYQLFKSDGTPQGTSIVLKIGLPGNSAVSRIHGVAGGILYFTADDNNGGTNPALWRSDGTAQGTFLLKVFSPFTDPKIDWLVEFQGKAWFRAYSSTIGYELWTSDGTVAGTKLFKEFVAGLADGIGGEVVEVAGSLFFPGRSVNAAYQLWKCDGTLAGTAMVHADTPTMLSRVGSKLYYRNQTSGGLWSSDGTVAGTKQVASVTLYSKVFDIGGGQGVCAALSSGFGLHVVDGSAATKLGTVTLPWASFGATQMWKIGQGKLVAFAGDDQTGKGEELWVTDGTAANTKLAADLEPGAASGQPRDLVVSTDNVYFRARGAASGEEPWVAALSFFGPAIVESYELGCPANRPQLSTDGAPYLGSPTFALTLSGAKALAPMVTIASARPQSPPLVFRFGYCPLLVDLQGSSIDGAATDAFGRWRGPLPIPMLPVLVGAELVWQAIVIDVTQTGVNQFTASTALRMRVGY